MQVGLVSSFYCHPVFRYTGCDCGKSNPSSRIVGGMETSPHQFPWNVYVSLGEIRGCGGSLISKQHVLTAAHCMDPFPSDLRLYMGNIQIQFLE